MATLYEYFVKDGSSNLTIHKTAPLVGLEGPSGAEIIARLHCDFEANAKFVSFYIPKSSGAECPEAIVLNKVSEILQWTDTELIVQGGFASEETDARDMPFSGRIFIYTEVPTRPEYKSQILTEAQAVGHKIIFRSEEYVAVRNRNEKPQAFISHDSRDKSSIAEALALELQKRMCTVWYDQFSLRIGDSLRESIELGLKECSRCILILTPNFLGNRGWSAREYDSIFTRELIEKQKLILPVWNDVSAAEVFKYSPMLADRVAVNWSLGVEEVARRLMLAIGST